MARWARERWTHSTINCKWMRNDEWEGREHNNSPNQFRLCTSYLNTAINNRDKRGACDRFIVALRYMAPKYTTINQKRGRFAFVCAACVDIFAAVAMDRYLATKIAHVLYWYMDWKILSLLNWLIVAWWNAGSVVCWHVGRFTFGHFLCCVHKALALSLSELSL